MPLNIPNLLTWARILLIPAFVCVFYLPADWLEPGRQNLLATVFFVVAAVTAAVTAKAVTARMNWLAARAMTCS